MRCQGLIYSFVYKNYLFVHFSKWQSSYTFNRYEPVYVNVNAGDEEGENITVDGITYTPETYLGDNYSWEDMVDRRAALTYEKIIN